ncbi:hypothetical protein VP01_2970g2 [Puccinia sorghi]|uniref:Uncharacterized protein n=1 Tax=Puccinia sorghi TaxID=27349 RepID=A0A0L6V2H1_9BASI|nr:hypothetical protein VP01_2970g2 [Puccinia sorghi]
MPRRRSCVFNKPRRKRNVRTGPSVTAQLIELDYLEEASRNVQYANEHRNDAPPSTCHDEDDYDNMEETCSAPPIQSCIPEDPPPTATGGKQLT